MAIQDGIVCQLVAELKLKLCDAPDQRYTLNAAAYQAYLKGLFYRNKITKENLEKAIGFYEEALRIAPDYALAHEGLAAVYTVMEFNSYVPPGTAAPKAEFHAQKALELDENLAGAYIALGTVKTMRNYDLAERERFYNQALLKNPNHRTARSWLAITLLARGEFGKAEAELLKVQELGPLSYNVRLNLAELYYYWRKPDKTIEQANLMLVANPESEEAHKLIAKAYAQKGDFDRTLTALEKISPKNPNRALILTAFGRIEEARKLAEDSTKTDLAKKDPYWIGVLFAASGEHEKALAWLEKSYAMRQADLVSMKIDPAFDSLRDDARYLDLLRRVGLAN